MGRVITGRGDVFNYKRGEMSRGMETVKPYDYGKLMTNIHRGAIITEKAMKSPLGASGSPLITAPKAAYGALKAGGKWAAEKLDLRDPDPLSEAARVKALAQGKVLPRPPTAAPVPGPQGGAMVRPDITARESGRQLVQRPDPAMGRPEDLPDRIAELFKLQAEAVTPDLAAGYQTEIDRLQAEYRNAINQRTQPQPPVFQIPTPQVAAGAPAALAPRAALPAPPGGFAAIGPETAALAGRLDKQRDIALGLQTEAHRQLGATLDRGTTEERAQAMGLKGMALLQNRPFNAAFRQMAAELGMDAQALANSMWAESEMDPTARNPRSGAMGMIQITKQTAGELETTPEAIAALNPIDQLEVIKDYFLRRKEQFPALDYSNPKHIDIAIFAPARAGDPLDTTMYSATGARPDQYTQNIEIDQFGPEGRPGRNDGKITVQERLTWMQDQAQRKGGPIPTLAPPRDLPPAPTRQDVTAQDLVGQRQQVDSGALVVPGVKPSMLSLGNMLVMARNVKNDADKNWVRQLALDDDAEIPWTSLGDLFTGAYKQRAAKAIEAAFPKMPDELKKAQTGYYKAKTTEALQAKPAKRTTGRRSTAKMPSRWRRPMTVLKVGIERREKRLAGLQKYLQALATGEGDVVSREFGPPKKDPMEVPTDFTARQKAWTDARALLTKYRRKRPAIMQAIRDQINDLNWEISQYEKLWQKGAVTSGYAQYHNAPPSTWLRSVYTTTEHERKGTGRLTFIPKAREKAEKKATAKATAKVAQPLILGDVVEEETETVIP